MGADLVVKIMKLNILLFTSASALVSLFQPFYEEVAKYAKLGTLQVITEVNNSDIWQSQESLPFQQEQRNRRIQNVTNLFNDISNSSPADIVDLIIGYNDIVTKNFGIEWEDLRDLMRDLFEKQPDYDILTDAEGLSELIFDASDDGYLTIEQEEKVQSAMESFVEIINDLHLLFELDLDNWASLLTDSVSHTLTFYTLMNDVFVFSLQIYLDLGLDLSALVFQIYSEIQDSQTEYNSLVGWTDICVSTSIWTFSTQVASFGVYLVPRWTDILNSVLEFWNQLVEQFMSNTNIDYSAGLISPIVAQSATEMIDSAKRTIAELELLTMPFDAQIAQGVKDFFC